MNIHDVRGLMAHDEVQRLAMLASSVPSWAAIVEVGTHTGLSTCWMARKAKAHITAIDPYLPARPDTQDDPFGFGYPEGAMHEFHRNLTALGLWDRVTHLRARSADVASMWVHPIGLLFVDAIHERAEVERDFRAWAPFVTAGGWIALHDYSEGYPDVAETVAEVILPTGQWAPSKLVGALWTARRLA